MSESVFVLNDDQYQREVTPIEHYIEQASFYLNLHTGEDIDVCKDYVQNLIRTRNFEGMRDPKVKFLERQENGDREEKETTLAQYIYSSVRQNEITAPTMTTYLPPSVKESLLVSYVEDNVKARGAAKKAGFAAKAAGNKELATIKDIEQTNKKLSNNALSGAHVTSSNPLFNRTAHSTLTSNCRVVASFGNANNEKIVTGNRHYWAAPVAMNNIISIVTHTDYAMIESVLEKYRLHVPSVDETMDCITYSTNLYWTNNKELAKIRETVEKLNDLQRVAFVYTGDLYHVRKYNDAFMRTFFERMSQKVVKPTENALERVKKIEEACLNLAHQICSKEVMGRGKDYKLMADEGVLETLTATGLNIEETLRDYSDFIQTFFTSKNIPASVAYIPESIRRAAVTSDTDSTIFTVQDWVKWYYGNYHINEESEAIAGVIVFFASQSITHVLSVVSANLGFAKNRLHTMAMKSEFFWPVFVNTSVAKHYMALCRIQEGNVFKKLEKEVKGVHLKSSNIPAPIRKHSAEVMDRVMYTVLENKEIDIELYLKEIADMERSIITSLLNGELTFYRFNKIKEPAAYSKDKYESPYVHHVFWQEVFAPKYGNIEEPPYTVIKVPTTMENPTQTKLWLESIQDKELAQRLNDWLVRYKKKVMPTLYFSSSQVATFGLPAEVKPIIDTRRTVLDLCNIYYLILESLGYFKKEGILISDLY